MVPVTGILASRGVENVGSYISDLFKDNSSDFNSIMNGLIQPDSENNTNEEELFAAIVTERIEKLKGADTAGIYQDKLEEQKGILQRPDGVTTYEQAANNALHSLVNAGTLTQEEANKICAEAFEAAQLDDNPDLLYDGRGSAGDPTIARMELESALEMARLKLEAFDNGNAEANIESHGLKTNTNIKSMVSNGNTMDGDGGFLWKPISDTTGNLVVLLPAKISSEIQSVVLKDTANNTIEAGQFSSMGNADKDGERAHYRFSKPGGSYPNNINVEVTLKSGETVSYTIANTASRVD